MEMELNLKHKEVNLNSLISFVSVLTSISCVGWDEQSIRMVVKEVFIKRPRQR